MSKIKILLAAVTFLMLSGQSYAGSSIGTSFGTLTTAEAIGQGRVNFGVGVGLADATSVVGTLTYGMAKYTDGRIKIGLVDGNTGDTKLSLGADFKWQIWNVDLESTNPFDLAVGGLFEYVDFDLRSVTQFGFQLIGSYPVKLSGGGIITPYGRFNTRLESLGEFTRNANIIESETNLEIGFSGGVQWKMTPTVWLFGEFQFDGNDGLFIGLDFNLQ